MTQSNKSVSLRRYPRDFAFTKTKDLLISSSVGGNPNNISPLKKNNTNSNNLNNTPTNDDHTKIATSESLLSYENDEGNHHITTEYNVNQVVLYNKT